MNPQVHSVFTVVMFGVLALLLTLLPGALWGALLVTNLKVTPAVPWAAFIAAALLVLLWRYLAGAGAPRSTSAFRQQHLRARRLAAPVFCWAIVAGLLSLVALTGLWIVLVQLMKSPGNALPDFARFPALTVVLSLMMAAIVGAVSEEAGMRGYFQVYAERRLGGPTAILLGALLMAPGHALSQGFVPPTLLFYFAVDLMFGVTAYLTNSILPGIAVHAAGLFTFFWLIWPKDAARHLVTVSSADVWFWLHVTQTLVFAALAVLAFRRLASIASA